MKRLATASVFVFAAACGTDPGDPSPAGGGSQTIVEGNVEYRAESLIMESFPVQIRTNVQITNLGIAATTVTFPDGCLVFLRVYRDAARTSLAWDSEREYGCTDALVPITVGSGQSKTISSPTVSAREILGDSLANGTYYFSAVIRPANRRLTLQAGSAELAK